MKRCILLCALLLALLCAVYASGEEACSHAETEIISSTEQCVDLEAGHILFKSTTSVCKECGVKSTEISEGPLEGHIFWMAESLHFKEDGMHLCAFVCSECLDISIREYACAGGAQCGIYHAQMGESPAVQYLERIADWKEQNPEEVIAQRWLAAQAAE